MLITRKPDIKASEITDRDIYLNRRTFLVSGLLAGLAGALALTSTAAALGKTDASQHIPSPAGKLTFTPNKTYSTIEAQTSYKSATGYNNFYEFSTDKEGIAELTRNFHPSPWTVAINGFVKTPLQYGIEDLMKLFPLEERIYRLRCVEGWSMVIPWVGFPLAQLVKKVEPLSQAHFVKFTTLFKPEEMPGQRARVLQWPYEEGLRMDEALHPLAFLALGMYGEVLPNQNGAPLRLVVPWKYGFKSIKSIVTISFVQNLPRTSWAASSPSEYGFYANVNPNVDHPRWSQDKERRIGNFLKQKTLPFNGYADQVASLYAGMDLRKDF